MNFKRIEWIFLVAFIILDCAMGISMSVFRHSVNSPQQNEQSRIVKEMHNESITFKPLSSKQHDGYYMSCDRSSGTNKLSQNATHLVGQNDHVNGEGLSASFNKSIKFNPNDPTSVLDPLVHDHNRILYGRHYRYDPELSSKHQIVYAQTMAGRPVLAGEGAIKFHVEHHDRISGYNQTYLNDIHILRPRNETISQSRAVIWLYKHNEIANNTSIRWAKLGYTRLIISGNKAVYLPTWVVELHSKSTGTTERVRVNAFTSAIMKGGAQTISTFDDNSNKLSLIHI